MSDSIYTLIVLALVTACVSRTVVKEDVFREPREWFEERSRSCPHWWQRKACYLFTCEYCMSHYVSAAVVWLVDFRLVADDWRGFFLAWLCVVAVANVFMSSYSHLRVEIGTDRVRLRHAEAEERKSRTA